MAIAPDSGIFRSEIPRLNAKNASAVVDRQGILKHQSSVRSCQLDCNRHALGALTGSSREVGEGGGGGPSQSQTRLRAQGWPWGSRSERVLRIPLAGGSVVCN